MYISKTLKNDLLSARDCRTLKTRYDDTMTMLFLWTQSQITLAQ